MAINNIKDKKEVLIVCLEFIQPLFSGNGILCQSLVRGLLHTQNSVTVLCARPSNHSNEPILIESGNKAVGERLDDHPDLTVVAVDVPPSTWRKLDRNSCYEYLASGCIEKMKKIPKHYDYVFAIDWSAIPAVDILRQNEILLSSSLSSSKSNASVFIFLVFRVFSSSKELYSSEDDYMFYVNRELDAVDRSDITFVLSHVDQMKLTKIHREQLELTGDDEVDKSTRTMKELFVHVPPLRNDFYHQCQKVTENPSALLLSPKIQEKKKYVLCNVRLSPEKNALLFSQIMVQIEHTLKELGLIPMLVGSVCDDEYAKEVYSTLPSQTVIINKFLSSEELISILDQTVLMIHPPLYDAFGMTISEAAASGVPSLIHHKNIGASSLFRVEEGEILHGDMSSSSIHDSVKNYLKSPQKLVEVSVKAKKRALSWNVNAYAQGLESTIKSQKF